MSSSSSSLSDPSEQSMVQLVINYGAIGNNNDHKAGNHRDNNFNDPSQIVVVVAGADDDDNDVDNETTAATHQLLKNDKLKYDSLTKKCVFEADDDDDDDTWGREGEGTATIGNEILNLVKNIVGGGGLSLSAGIATFANNPTALIPTIMIIILMGLLNAYSFSLLGRICAITKSKTYQEAWDKTMGRRGRQRYDDDGGTKKYNNTSMWVGIVVSGKAILGCWCFSIVIASTCQPLLKMLLFGRLYSSTISKAETLLVITIVILLPLCLHEKLSSLAMFSVFGQIGTLTAAVTMFLRYFDGSYQQGGFYFDDLPPEHVPAFGTKGATYFFTPESLVLVSLLSTGYVAHYNAPKYYFELKDRTTERFNIVVNISFLLSALTYICISSLGFLTFGENCAGFILDNYSYRDPWATISRFGIALSVIFAYPLLFQGGRDGLWDLLGQRDRGRDDASSSSYVVKRQMMTIILLTTITFLAIYVNDLKFVSSFAGATLASAIIYIFPPVMFQALASSSLNNDCTTCCCCSHTTTYRITNWEIKESQAMLCVGSILAVCGTAVTIAQTFF